MGNCNSCGSTSAVTAKVILQDGRLQEFPNPVKVSQILERYPNCFLCSSDDMDFDTILSAIDEEDQLQLGELYFALPLNWLNSPLRTEEMCALAIKASQALKLGNSTGIRKKFCGCGIKEAEPLLLPNKRVAKSSNCKVANVGHTGGVAAAAGGGIGGGRGSGGFVVRRKTRGTGGRLGSSFTAKLTVILEEQDD